MSGKDQRFEAMVEAYSADLYRYAYWLCHNQHMAEDLVQETFLRAWSFLDGLKEKAKAKSWLITTLRRENARQYEHYRPQIDDIDLDTLPQAADGESTDIAALRQAITKLPETYREPLVLQVIWGYSGEEIAAILDMPRASINTRLFRARQQLKRLLEGDIVEGLEAVT